MIAMQLGKAVYCEKPLCHDIAEARRLAEMARQCKVATQMGNQGHCMEGYRRLCEYIWAGAIGQITETHSWTDRANGGFGPRPAPEPPPAGMHWDAWIGPAPYREYHKDLHAARMARLVRLRQRLAGKPGLPRARRSLLGAEARTSDQPSKSKRCSAAATNATPPARAFAGTSPRGAGWPPLKAYWYDGRVGAGDPGDGNKATQGKKGPRNLPPLLLEMQKKYPQQKYVDSGTFYVGEKGIFYTSTYGQEMHIMPKEKMEDLPAVPKSLPRPESSFADFLRAVREGKTDTAASFDYAARLTEFVLLGQPGATCRSGQEGGVERPGDGSHQPDRTEPVGQTRVP